MNEDWSYSDTNDAIHTYSGHVIWISSDDSGAVIDHGYGCISHPIISS